MNPFMGRENRLQWSRWLFAVNVFGLLALVMLTGCVESLPRAQTGDDAPKDIVNKVPTIGDMTVVGNVDSVVVQGIGLVTNLRGTGGAAPPGDLRKVLEKDLRQRKVEHVKQLLDSSDTAMVIVTGIIPPGARKEDLIDVVVTLPHLSKTTNLRGGELQQCFLRLHQDKQSINPKHRGTNSILQGHVLAKAAGPLLVGLDANREEGPNLRRGQIWDGAVIFSDRPYFFILKKDRKASRFANAVAQRLNAMYQDDERRQRAVERYKQLLALGEVTNNINRQFKQTLLDSADIAKAKNKDLVLVNVPMEYRLNHQRYLRVTRLIPLLETAKSRVPYRQRLQVMLQDPEETIRAALRLEALGKESLPALRSGLKNKHPLVRFASAEALAYLASTSGVGELATAAEKHTELRAYCLTALASLNEPLSAMKLAELLSSRNSKARYGAFRALQLLRNNSRQIKGELMNESYWLHRVAPNSEPLVHYSLHRRAEVVVFGRDVYLVPPFRILSGEFTIVAAEVDNRCTITRFNMQTRQEIPKQCSLKLDDVLRTMAALGAEYPDVVDLLQETKNRQCVTAAVAVNAVPQAMDIEELAKKGADPDFLRRPPQPAAALDSAPGGEVLVNHRSINR